MPQQPWVQRTDARGLSDEQVANAPRHRLQDRQLYDLDMLLMGAFAPLSGFMERKDYESVRDTMHLASGELWPLPVVLDVSSSDVDMFRAGKPVVLTDPYGTPLALLHPTDVYTPNRAAEVDAVYGTNDTEHFGVRHILERTRPIYVGGRVEQLEFPRQIAFAEYRNTPAEQRTWFKKNGWKRVVGFQTRNPIHRAHFELLRRAADEYDAKVLIHPAVGETKDGDIDATTRVRIYKTIIDNYAKDFATLNVMPLAMRMAGPREALMHAIIRKNYGCTHFIVGRDHAGPGKDARGVPYYEPYAAQELAQTHADDIGIKIVAPKEMVYVEELDSYHPVDTVPLGHTVRSISGTELRRMLREGRTVPTWFSFPEVMQELEHAAHPQGTTGFAVFFTGLSGSGKSTIAQKLKEYLEEHNARPATLLDGDIVRNHLSKGLGFSKEDRNTNIRRIGFVASEVVRHGGVAICAAIAPYELARRDARVLVEEHGSFVEVHVATPLVVCESRDVKGLYDKARKGLIKGFTGINDPYEEPEQPDVVVNKEEGTVDEAVQTIVGVLQSRRLVQ
jgi:sulfate adenylyltransferase